VGWLIVGILIVGGICALSGHGEKGWQSTHLPMTGSTTAKERTTMSNNQTFIARVRLPNGSVQKIEVKADHAGNARALVEAQYGKENVIYVGQ
jgi:hypothetical protein